MRRKLQNMLETWSEAGLHLRLSLVTGEVVTGRLEELDGDEAVIEPVIEGETLPITVVLLEHVVTASYLEPGTEEEAAPDEVVTAGDHLGAADEIAPEGDEIAVVAED